MRCTVFFANTRETRFTVLPKAMAARAASNGEYQAVAVLDAADNEEVFTRLQNNFDVPWSDNEAYIGTDDSHRRSMSVGDIIVWENRTTEVVDGCGFKEYPKLIGSRLHIAAEFAEKAAVA